MNVSLSNVGKSFGREVVFREVTLELRSGSRTAILGPNGSGKSTLLQVIGGAIIPTQGHITHRMDGQTIAQEEVYRHVSIAAPYLGLYEELTLDQAIAFHARFKPLLPGFGVKEAARTAYLENALHKQVSHFSSGMKQRLKLALAILSDTPLLLLDEPTSNLDADAIAWFGTVLAQHVGQRTLVVASNRQTAEYALCAEVVEVSRFKG